MEIGIGLPTTTHAVTGATVMEWARRAEHRGFSVLGVLDRLVADNHDPVVTLAAVAGVTERIRLATTVLIAGYRGVAVPLAKQLATVDELSGGRLTVGVASGGRMDDFVAAEVPYEQRGRRLDSMIEQMKEVWSGDHRTHGRGIGPAPGAGNVPLWVGGHSPAAMRRAARSGKGWIAGGASGLPYRELVRRARGVWVEEGRDDAPRMVALSYFSLGERAEENAAKHLHDYYSRSGSYAERAVEQVVCTESALKERVNEYRDAGCDELIFFPCHGDLEQVDLLTSALHGLFR